MAEMLAVPAASRLSVHRLLPGCWEVTCPWCPDGPVAAQVGTWRRAWWRALAHAEANHPVLSAADPEPPVRTVVRDSCGTVWENDEYRPCCWVRPDADVHDPESWIKVAGNYGPVMVLRWGDDD